MWNEIVTLYENYIGTGMISGLFLAALIYLFVTEKNKAARTVFLYMPVVTLAFYFCPFFAALIYALTGEEIYYRLLWLVPVVPVLAYAAVKIISEAGEKKRLPAGIAIAGIFMVSGSLVYQSPYFKQAQNAYHVPQAVVESRHLGLKTAGEITDLAQVIERLSGYRRLTITEVKNV